MYCGTLLFVLVLAAQAFFLGNGSLRSQEVTPMPEKKPSTKSDRERAELRGLVRQCTEERITPASPGFPGTKFSTTTEYDREGRILSVTYANPDGSEWTTAHIYDGQGRLLKSSSGQADGSLDDTAYHYDTKGRLLKTSSGRPGGALGDTTYRYDEEGRLVNVEGKNPLDESTSFQYDERGRKTRILKSNLPPSTQGAYGPTALGYSPQGLDLYHSVPHGGMVKTLYDESDRPTETQVYDSDGHLIERLVQRFDAGGRPAELKVVLEDLAATLPAEMKAQLLAEAGAAEEINRQLTALLGARREMFSMSYTYDEEGHLTEQSNYVGYNQETVTKFAYNANGDKIEERSITSGDPNPPRDEPGSQNATSAATRQESEVTYTYEYDDHGNWTKQVVRSKPGPDGAAQDSTICRRTISYY